jgi:Mg-chelatase subunit ChlD
VLAAASTALAKEQDPLVTCSLLSALAGRPRLELVEEGGVVLAEALVHLLDHPAEPLAERARTLLARLPPLPLGERADILRGWWERGRDALAREQERLKRERAAAPPAPASVPAAPGETRTVEREAPDLYALLESLSRDGLELVIVLDSTGSMGPVIAAAKAQCQALVRRLRWLVPQFRAGLVTYDDGARLRVPLTTDAAELQQGFDKLAAAGGGDIEEGVDKGLALALRQDTVGWSRKANRLAVVVGDAPPHAEDVAPLLRRLVAARDDELFDHPVTVHCVSTDPAGVDHFAAIAHAGRGVHVSLGRTDLLAHELVLLTFGERHRALAEAWLEDVEKLREALDRG